jgi:C1A family cysteine protease
LGDEDINIINNKIIEKGYSWSAGTTSISKLPPEIRRRYLGLATDEAELRRINTAMVAENALAEQRGMISVYPASWDWRGVSRRNWTTKIKNQGGCGSCVAFATVGMIESNLKIFKRDSSFNPDLSEADLFFRGCGECCARGWTFVPALQYAKSSGIPDEACFPYDDDLTAPCPDRDNRVTKIKSWRSILIISQAKEWISLMGPIMTSMEVYDDFFYYEGGIYKNACGGHIGDHAVCIVGYDDANGCWICKNSWGTEWGEAGWFRIAYGDSGIGNKLGYFAVQFADDDDIVMPKDGRVFVRLNGKNTAFEDEVRLYYPEDKPIFNVVESNIGKSFEIGSFSAGTRLILALKTSEGTGGYTYYTEQSMNKDAADHVNKVQTGTYKWELRWEDLYGLGEQDYNDVIIEVEIFDKSTGYLVVPKDGHVFVRLKSKRTSFEDKFLLCHPENRQIFDATVSNIGKNFDLGSFKAGASLAFALSTPEGYTYYMDQPSNPDSLPHVKKLLTGSNKWEFRWSDRYQPINSDYKDIVVEVEIAPSSNDDILLAQNCHVTARFVSRGTNLNDEFWLFRPEESSRKLFDATGLNIGKTFDVGDFPAGTRLTFGIKTSEGDVYYTDSNLNADARVHVIKLSLGLCKCLLRWEDQSGLKDTDYNDVIVEILMTPNS